MKNTAKQTRAPQPDTSSKPSVNTGAQVKVILYSLSSCVHAVTTRKQQPQRKRTSNKDDFKRVTNRFIALDSFLYDIDLHCQLFVFISETF